MGLTHQKLIVKPSHESRRKALVQFLIDSGAVCLVLDPFKRRLVPMRMMLARLVQD